jgi:hypothetical protein
MRERLAEAGRWSLPGASGPEVARLFGRAYGLVLVIAWLSLAAQVRLLIGRNGLLPLAALLGDPGFREGAGWLAFPSLLRVPALAGDGILLAGTLVGAGLGVAMVVGLVPRVACALSTVLYLSYAVACRSFLAFQWDNLLLECGLLATFLPWDRPAPVVHLLFRVLAFKLYFESGLAKWQSPIGDWHDGSAMTYYYETAPLPTWLAFHAHHLPAWWHRLESQLTLALELVVPFAFFGPRRARLIAAVALTGFQIINAATANYGFFCYLAVTLHLFLLDDGDVARLRECVRTRLPARLLARIHAPAGPPSRPVWDRWPPALRRVAVAAGVTAVTAYVGISLVEGLQRFGPSGSWSSALLPLERVYAPFRLVNSYHLFASITRERIEPQIETRTAGGGWQEHDFRYKPGDPGRAPPFVAPHQPRVDFLFWFHGLSWQRTPTYLVTLLDRICNNPAAVRAMFSTPLPDRAQAVRVTYHRYRFASLSERRAARLYWRRSVEGTTGDINCASQL